MQFELVRTADVDLTVLMRDDKDGSEHMYRHVLPGLVVQLYLELGPLRLLSDDRL